MQTNALLKKEIEEEPVKSPLPRFFDGNPPFKNLGVIFGDPSLPDEVKPEGKFTEREFEEMQEFLDVFKTMPEYSVTVFQNHATLWEDLQREKPDLVINLCDNGYRNNPKLEMHITAMLDMLGIPYTGASTFSLGTCYDKALVGSVSRDIGVSVPEEITLFPHEKLPETWNTYPTFIKPSCADNSVGINKNAICHNRDELIAQIDYLQKLLPNEDLLVQEYLPGSEYRVTIFGNRAAGYNFMPTMERDFSNFPAGVPTFVTQEFKFGLADDDVCAVMRSKPAILSDETKAMIERMSIALMERFACNDYMMCDYRVDKNGIPKMIDLNPNPSWDSCSFISRYDAAAGYRYEDIIRHIIEVASIRTMATKKAAKAG